MSKIKKGANINDILSVKKNILEPSSPATKKVGLLDVAKRNTQEGKSKQKKAEIGQKIAKDSKSEQKTAEVNTLKVTKKPENKKGKKGNKKEAEYFAFIDFISKTELEKEGKNQNDFAEEYGVNIATLSLWKKRPDFYREVEKRRRVWGRDRTGEIMGYLYNQIRGSKKPTGRDVMVWLQYFEGFAPKTRFEDDTPIERRLDKQEREVLALSLLNAGMANKEEAEAFATDDLEIVPNEED